MYSTLIPNITHYFKCIIDKRNNSKAEPTRAHRGTVIAVTPDVRRKSKSCRGQLGTV